MRTVRRDRPFGLTDGMFLVAASAIAFAGVRPFFPGLTGGRSTLVIYLACVIGVLASWTPTVFWLRLRNPRPTVRRLTREPGFVAGIAGTALLALGALAVGILGVVRAVKPIPSSSPFTTFPVRVPDPYLWLGVMTHFSGVVGAAVIAGWLVLALSGRRKPTRSWLDVLGRSLGTGWVILFVINCCVRLAPLAN